MTSFSQRLPLIQPFIVACFIGGFAIALWNPQPRFILTAALGITAGILILGPYAAAALYALRIQHFLDGHLRWPLCFLLALSAVYLLNYALGWSPHQFALAAASALIGTTIGHDATLAVLELRKSPSIDRWMVVLFPFLIGLAVLAGYSSLGFFSGIYQLIAALVR